MNSTFVHSSGLPVGTDMISAEALSPSKFQTNIFGSRSRGENMAMYIPISNVHAETMQTLYLMNPAVAGYTDTLTPGNVMLISNAANTTVTVSDFSCNDQEQRHSFQMTIPTASGSRQSPIGGGGNELTFLEPINTSSTSQSFNGHLNSSIGLCHANVADISPVGLQLHNLSGINEQSSLSPSQLSLQLDQPETMTGQRKGPTLSLSPHDPSGFQMLSFQKSTAEFNVNCPGIIQAPLENSFRVDNSVRGEMIANGISDPSHSFDTNKQSQFNLDRLAGFSSLRNSKYLRVTQELLNEVSNPGKEDNFNLTKCRNASLSSETAAEKEDDAKECGGKSKVIGTKQAQQNSVEESGKSNKIELNVAERQELQIKKTKLMAMLDEVDQRYKQYHHQMQIVVSCFEAVTHIGAAKTYTSLALKTISRHFRCLRDAIASQIHRTGKVLNECNVSPNGKDDTSRLRLVDQQLRQQRALQKLGMIQPNAWRPQRGLPDRAVSVLRAWLFEHFLHPYPKDSDKVMLAKQAGLTRSQVSNWFINARVRLWKPMVEEMYMEELKEAGLSVEKNNTAPDDEKAVALSDEDSAKRENEYDSHVQHEQDIDSQYGVSEHPMHVGDRVSNARQPPDLRHNTNCRLSSKGVSTDEIPTKTSVEVDGQGNFKKARNEYEDSAESFLQNSSNKLVNTRAAERSPDSFCEKKFIDERYTGANYSLLHNDIVLSGNDANSGQYQFECLNRLANGSFISRLSGGSISLTLGLKQSESFLLSEPQESCLPSEPRSAELGQLGNSYCNINDTTPM